MKPLKCSGDFFTFLYSFLSFSMIYFSLSFYKKSDSSENQTANKILVKPVYKDHPSELENVTFMSRCPLYTGYNNMHYSLMRTMKLPFIDSDLLCRGALYRQ